MRTLAPTAVTDPAPDPATPDAGSRFEASSYRAASRNAARGLARDAKVLPEDVRWFYLRALRSAARRDAPLSLADGERPEELARLLDIASSSEDVVGCAGRSALSAISLALSEKGRRVTVFDPVSEPGEIEDYLGFVEPEVRTRIDFRFEPDEVARNGLSAADFVFVDPSADKLVAKLRLEGAVIDGALVWRMPLGGRRRPGQTGIERLRLPALGLIIGTAVAVVLPSSLTDSGPGMSGSARTGAAVEPGAADPRASDSRTADSRASNSPPASGSRASDSRPSNQRPSNSRTSREPARRSASNVRRQSGDNRRQTGSRRRSGTPRQPVRAVGAGAFSGTGDRKLGTLRVDQPMTMQWTIGAGSFTIVSDTWRFRPSRQSGTTVLTPGTYRGFAVRATASWKLKLSPAGEYEQP